MVSLSVFVSCAIFRRARRASQNTVMLHTKASNKMYLLENDIITLSKCFAFLGSFNLKPFTEYTLIRMDLFQKHDNTHQSFVWNVTHFPRKGTVNGEK